MTIANLDVARASVDPLKVDILTDIFRRSRGSPPGVPVARYRADHPEWFDALDRLESGQLFLRRSSNGTNYVVRVYALPILTDDHAALLLAIANEIFQNFKAIYRERLSEQVAVAEIIDAIGRSRELTEEALFYMADGHAIWSGISNNFPYANDSFVCISEAVLRHENFDSVLSEFYAWHIVNPQHRVRTEKLHGPSDMAGASIFGVENDSIPKWYVKLDDRKKALISEIDAAIRTGLTGLPTMGLRTLVESIMLDYVKDEQSFTKNLAAFRRAGYITNQHAGLIAMVVDAGHAAVHRAYFPDPGDVRLCVDVVRHLMEGMYILKPQLDSVASRTPKRDE